MKKARKSGNTQRQAAKAARRRTIVAARNRQGATHVTSLATSSARAVAASHAVSHCVMMRNIFDIGIGHVVLARALSPSRIAASVFMVDVHCLGVKDAFYQEYSSDRFREAIHHLASNGTGLVDIEPEYACKLVSDAVDYAHDLGFAPHKDYAAAAALFGTIDPTSCTAEFVFGKDGKPFYVQGPRDTPGKVRIIMRNLTERLGEGNFDFVLAV